MTTTGFRNVWLSVMFWVFGLIGTACAAEISVSVDRNPVGLNESFQITFSADQEPDGSPDFTPLQENFEVLNQQRNSNMSWVNGKSSRNEQWIVNVMAKQAGKLLIPPIAFGSDTSSPLPITVTDQPQVSAGKDEIFLDVQATPENPYVQSQVLFTLRIYFRVQITQSRLSDLEVKDALVEQLGEDSTYRTQINGVEYGVLERKYAIFPQQSGVFTIAPLTLTTEVATNRQPRFNGFFNRQTTETRRVSSKAVTLNVQPAPKSFTASAWLSAESLELTESWSDNHRQIKVGEPLTRTIKLLAKGATVGQLPELAGQVTIDGLKTYPDQPVLNEEKQADGLVATREEKIAYIPSQAGDYTLPALNIAWFNTKTQKTETARLPAVTLHALPVSGANVPAPILPKVDNQVTAPASATVTPVADAGYWPWLSGLLALGWLTNLLWLYLRRKAPTDVEIKPKSETEKSASSAERQLKKACGDNDPRAARKALLVWARSEFGVENLNALAAVSSDSLAAELSELNRHLYAEQGGSWSGTALWRAFSSQSPAVRKRTTDTDSALEPLFKL